MSDLLAKTLRFKKESLAPASKRMKSEGDTKMASIFSPSKTHSNTYGTKAQDLSGLSYEEAMEACK